MTIDSRQFRSALGSFATGITIVTTRDPAGADVGLTVNSFNSVSLDPPMVLWSLAKKSRSRQAFIDAGQFAVHILALDQSELATRFASPLPDRFAGLSLERSEGGMPLLRDCAARFQCRVISRYEGGDHDIFVGEVNAFENFGRPALVLQAGRYAVAVEKPERPLPNDGVASGDAGRNSITYLLARAYYQVQVAIRPELARRNLSETDYHMLTIVALNGPCTAAQVTDLIAVSGHQVSLVDMQRLALRQLLSLSEKEGADPIVQLTEAGRESMVRIAAMAKAIEEDAVTDLGYTEVDIFKQMLRKIIRRTRLPWQKDPLVSN